ncbi:NAD-dependent protein deacetylase sirtuin-1-like [Asterias rubens]|uniref:NAD-dependent protein deacetylase sirtuin-1-like n=1 Tax=Asterias rubens TaxID=7604 RepID=UPI001455D753|nr:NAD-dependent protein deacetylase sirtuin-1-like [Asterias rubens]
MGWLHRQMMSGVHPRSILSKLIPNMSASLPQDLDEFEVWSIIADYFNMLREPPRRKKLQDVNSFEDALNLLRSSKRIMVLTGAGVSVSCGIPDFRSRDGVYARLAVDFPDLPDPQAIFDINYFRRNPKPFFKFAKEIYPGEFRPSTCHKFIALLEQHGKLLRNFSQNIDTLEQVAGITKVLQCHGSFATAHCTNCNYEVDADAIRQDIFNQVVPHCPHCPRDPDVLAVMKPDIVFFGEGLPKDFYHCLDEDKDKIDLLIVIGSSLKVQPVATIPNAVPGNIPQILINREPLPHMNFDIELLGDGDVIVNEICRRLGDGWDQICDGNQLEETSEMPDVPTPAGSDSVGSDFETMVTPKRPEEGFEGADSTSWVGRSSDGSLQSCDDHAEATHQDDNSKGEGQGDIKKSTTPERLSKSPHMCSSAERASSAGTTIKINTETNTVNSKPELDESSVSEDDTQQDQKSHPNRCLQSRDTKTVKDIRVTDKSQQQDGVISSTVCEDSKPQGAKPNCTNANQLKNDQISQTNEAQRQQKRENLEAENIENTKDAHTVANRRGDNDNNEGATEEGSRSLSKTSADHTTQPKRKRKSSIALYLQSSSYLFVPPNRYIFHGAEVYPPSKSVSPCNDTDDINDRHSVDDHDNSDIEDHLRDVIGHSEVPSTSNALTGDRQHGDLPPAMDSPVLHLGKGGSCEPQGDPVFSDTHKEQERSELHAEKTPLSEADEGV